MQDMTNPTAQDDAIIDDTALTLFQRVLLNTDGTVTQLLELYTAQPIRVHKLGQDIAPATASAVLQTNADDLVLNRRILLRTEQRNLLYAESLFVVERLPASVRRQLLETDRPIGLLWRDHRMETYREIVVQQREPVGELAQHFDLPAQATLLARSYLIFHQARPMGMITEKFPLDYFR